MKRGETIRPALLGERPRYIIWAARATDKLFDTSVWNAGRMTIALMALASLLIAILLTGKGLKAQWGIYDDHEIAMFLGPDGKMTFSEIPGLLLLTEVGHMGHFQRFRPVYFTLRLFETALWGDRPALWYAARTFILGVSIALFWIALANFVGILPGFACVVYALSFPFWGDVFARLGPSETYCVMGTALFCASLAWLLTKSPEKTPVAGQVRAAWILATVGFVLAAGSKENFLIFAPILWLSAWHMRRSGLGRATRRLSISVATIFAFWIVTAVGMAVGTSGTDVYAQDASLLYRLSLLGHGFAELIASRGRGLWIGSLLVLGLLLLGRRRIPNACPICRRSLLLLAALWFLYAFQYLFYNGAWPAENRYDFPGMLVPPLGYLIAFVTSLAVLQAQGARKSVIRASWILLVCALLSIASYSRFPLRWSVQANVERTRTYTASLRCIESSLRQDPASSLLVVSHAVEDYEKVSSVVRILRSWGVTNPFYLDLQFSGVSPSVPPWTVLIGEMQAWSAHGKAGWFSPRRELSPDGETWAVGISGDTPPWRMLARIDG